MSVTSLQNYDEAVFDKFKAMYENTVYAPPNAAFAWTARELNIKEDEISLPLISIWDVGFETSNELFSHPRLHRGDPHRYVNPELPPGSPGPEVWSIMDLPVPTLYQVDVWAAKKKDGKRLFSELLFWTRQYPNVDPTLEDVVETHSCKSPKGVFYLEPTDIQNNTDLEERGARGKLFRYTITFKLNCRITKKRVDKPALIFPIKIIDFHNGTVYDDHEYTGDE